MIAWTPYAAFALIKQFGDSENISPAMSVLPSLFAKTSICYNPIIYVGMNSQFRQAFDRYRGISKTPNNTTINTTTINQISRETDTKKISATIKVKNKFQLPNTTIQSDGIDNGMKGEFELCVINDGKSILLPKNLYQSF